MAGGGGGNVALWKRFKPVPPIQLPRNLKTLLQEKILVAKGRHHDGLVLIMKFAQCRQVHMIIVVVAEQDELNGRQFIKWDARRMKPFWPGKAERTCPLAPNRIGEDIEPVHLYQECAVIDKGDAAVVPDLFGWEPGICCNGPVRPGRAFPLAHPFNYISKPFGYLSVWVGKSLSVEMIRYGATVARGGEEPAGDKDTGKEGGNEQE